jgi:hypothetical protein
MEEIRRLPDGRKLLNKPIATDDLGNEVYQCQYSKKAVTMDKAVFLGPLLPNVSGTYVCHEEGKEARKQSKKHFDEMDANCNDCKNLQRVSHEKRKDGCLKGVCMTHAVRIIFHPDDWMGNECWEQR